MPEISAKLIRKPRKPRTCARCMEAAAANVVRVFGRACEGDQPYAVYICARCAVRYPKENPKTAEAAALLQP